MYKIGEIVEVGKYFTERGKVKVSFSNPKIGLILAIPPFIHPDTFVNIAYSYYVLTGTNKRLCHIEMIQPIMY